MATNDPLPGQLTVGRLRALLEGVHDQAVVALMLRETIEVPESVKHLFLNVRVARKAGPVVRLEVYCNIDEPAPDPDPVA